MVKLSYLINDLPFGKFLTRILIWSWSPGGATHCLSASVVTIALRSCNSKADRTINCLNDIVLSNTYSRYVLTNISMLFTFSLSSLTFWQWFSQVKGHSSVIMRYLQITHFQMKPYQFCKHYLFSEHHPVMQVFSG